MHLLGRENDANGRTGSPLNRPEFDSREIRIRARVLNYPTSRREGKRTKRRLGAF